MLRMTYLTRLYTLPVNIFKLYCDYFAHFMYNYVTTQGNKTLNYSKKVINY